MIGAKPGTPKGHNPDPATGHRATSLVGFGSKSEVWVHNLEVRFAFSNGLGRPDLSGQLSADFVAKVGC
jgi:hypothetical protein